MPAAAILGGIGAGVNLFSSLFSKKEQPTNINPYTAQRLKDLMGQLNEYQGQFNSLGGEANAARTAQRSVASDMGRVSEDAENMTQASPNAWFEQYLGNVPEYQAIAKQVSEMATEQFGRDLGEQTNRNMEMAMKAAGDSTAGQGFSGAAASAAGQAASTVIGNESLQRTKMASDIFNQTFNAQAGQGQGLAFQDQQMQFQNALQQLQTALGGYQGQANALGSVGNQALGQQANVGGQLNTVQGGIQDITQPVYSSPTYVNPLGNSGDAIASLGQFIEGGQQQTMMADILKAFNERQNTNTVPAMH